MVTEGLDRQEGGGNLPRGNVPIPRKHAGSIDITTSMVLYITRVVSLPVVARRCRCFRKASVCGWFVSRPGGRSSGRAPLRQLARSVPWVTDGRCSR